MMALSTFFCQCVQPMGRGCFLLFLPFSLLNGMNPLLPDFHADPSIREWDGRFWIYPSTDEPGSTSWLEMRRWEVFSSTNLVDWKGHGEIFSLEDITWAQQAAFAPDALKWNDWYYFFFPADFQIGVAVSDRPYGPFRDAIGEPLIRRKEGGIDAFDPHIFIDDDGRPYLFFGGSETVGVVELGDDLVSRAGPIRRLPLKHYAEGIWVHRREGLYYFTYPMHIHRNGRTEQLLVHSVAENLLGPYEYRGPFLDNHSRNSHHSIREIKGRWYLFYHIEGPSPYERRVCADYLEYWEDGTIKPVRITVKGIDPLP